MLYELKNYEAASIILFDVVEKYPTSPAYPEALYYLADSLFLKRDYLSSRRFFEKIVEQGPANPRYQESLQRLIDLALHTSDYSPVDGYIEKLNAMPTGKQLPSVPYVEGKYFFFRQQYDKALATLKQIGPDHVYYFHSLYFVGAANVALGGEHLADAIQAFGTILKTPAKTDSQKRITELAHMALARIYYDRGQFTNALERVRQDRAQERAHQRGALRSGLGQHQGQGVRQGGALARSAHAQRARLAAHPRGQAAHGAAAHQGRPRRRPGELRQGDRSVPQDARRILAGAPAARAGAHEGGQRAALLPRR